MSVDLACSNTHGAEGQGRAEQQRRALLQPETTACGMNVRCRDCTRPAKLRRERMALYSSVRAAASRPATTAVVHAARGDDRRPPTDPHCCRGLFLRAHFLIALFHCDCK